jgi:hypothetical protein
MLVFRCRLKPELSFDENKTVVVDCCRLNATNLTCTCMQRTFLTPLRGTNDALDCIVLVFFSE